MEIVREIIGVFKTLDAPVQIVFTIGALVYLVTTRKPGKKSVKNESCKEYRDKIYE